MSAVGETISNDDELLRRVHPNNGLIRDAGTGAYTVSSAALRDPDGRGEISVYATRLLPERQGPLDLAAHHPGQALFAFDSRHARRAGFDVQHRPDQDPGPFASAHCNLITPGGWDKRGFKEARNALLQHLRFVEGSYVA